MKRTEVNQQHIAATYSYRLQLLATVMRTTALSASIFYAFKPAAVLPSIPYPIFFSNSLNFFIKYRYTASTAANGHCDRLLDVQIKVLVVAGFCMIKTK